MVFCSGRGKIKPMPPKTGGKISHREAKHIEVRGFDKS